MPEATASRRRTTERPPADSLTRDQLHGLACHMGPDGCSGSLAPDGHVHTEPAEPGAPLGWAVVACEAHREAA